MLHRPELAIERCVRLTSFPVEPFMKRRRVAFLGFLICALAPACGRDSSSPPNPVSPVVEPAHPTFVPEPFVVTGTVTDDTGAPVRSAEVSFWNERQPVTTVTDASGMYRAAVPTTYSGTSLWVDAAGYERSDHWVNLIPGGQNVRDLRIHRIVTIEAGEQRHIDLKPDEGACGFDLELWCRRVRVHSKAPGMLTLTTGLDATMPSVGLVEGFVKYPFQFVSTLRIPVDVDTTIPVDVVVSWTTSTAVPVTLSTSLE
jgi:hypothetical protein